MSVCCCWIKRLVRFKLAWAAYYLPVHRHKKELELAKLEPYKAEMQEEPCLGPLGVQQTSFLMFHYSCYSW